MIRPRTRLVLFALLCAAVLLPRLGGPHLHLCLDGSAPALALHMSDSVDSGLDHGAGDSHDDQTVEVSSPVLGKVWPPGVDGALLFLVVLLLGVSRQALLLPAWHGIPVPASPLFLRPPLRGPPA